ncbi:MULTISPECIES: MFS transporter [Actinomadura]|uniref:MFS transporter n=1 Tax=Actinomadura litoris TaxID=2678616 RepID=A0A7K1L8T3_9ACTN|nr:MULTISPECIES: MFS transporter [Actinomadura]MBT2212938.1 MFS transporter [Actinomadura sp. NEAU-AAG7]MUN40844.1 MFS transporter [Actinomadura litoris]
MAKQDLREAAAPPGPVRWTVRSWVALLVFSGVILLDGLENSMIAVAIPEIQREFGMDASTAQWLTGGYFLTFGGFLLLGGRSADLFGRRRTLVVAMAVFAALSLVGAVVDDGALVIASRFLKGLAAAFTAPAAMSLLTTTFPEGPQRNRAFGIFNVFEASGYSSGLLVGGLIAAVSWRATFVLPIPLAVLIAIGAVLVVPKDPPRRERVRLDPGGTLTLVGGTMLLVFTVVSVPEAGWSSLPTLAGFAVAAALLAAFVGVERVVKAPLIRLGLLRDRSLLAANLSIALLYGAAMGFQFLLTQYLQTLNGWEPWQFALVLLPAGLMVVVIGPKLGAMMDRFGVTTVAMVGLVSFVPCYLLMLRIGEDPDLWTVLMPVSLLWGVGFALTFASLMVAGTSGVPDEEQGVAAGLLNSSLQIGGAFGLAIVTATIAPATDLATYRPGVWVILGIAVLAIAAQAVRRAAPGGIFNR